MKHVVAAFALSWPAAAGGAACFGLVWLIAAAVFWLVGTALAVRAGYR